MASPVMAESSSPSPSSSPSSTAAPSVLRIGMTSGIDNPNIFAVNSVAEWLAVALQYDSKTMTSPKVVAKGADFLAMRIRQIATANGVPLVERKSLAQALYKTVEVGQEVPPQYYGAVAEILAYVYRLSGRKSA